MSNPNPPNQWKPGESGNPKGKPPKGYSITEWFRNMFNENPEVKDAIAKSIVKKAMQGDITAQKLVWQYMDGMPPQNLNIGGQEGNQLKIVIEDYGAKDNTPTKTERSPDDQ